jgi:hypothetical protein
MGTVRGTSASGKVERVIHVRTHGNKLMLNIGKPGDLFNRQGAVIVSAAELLKTIAAAKNGKPK